MNLQFLTDSVSDFLLRAVHIKCIKTQVKDLLTDLTRQFLYMRTFYLCLMIKHVNKALSLTIPLT